jgi:GT2 family glycosyltransferase
MTPRLSVLMTVFNAVRYVESAVASVLAQDFADFEFIIIDDGCTDGSSEVLERLSAADARIRLLKQPNRGLVASLNRGIQEARAHLVARMDADDLSLPGRFTCQMDELSRRPALAAVGGHVRLIDAEGRESGIALSPVGQRHIAAVARLHSPLFHPAATIRRELVNQVGGYRAVLESAEDYDLWLRLLDAGYEVDNVPALVLSYRVHPENMSITGRGPQAARALMARAASRMRQAGLPDPIVGLAAVTEAALQQLPQPFRPCDTEIWEAGHGPIDRATAGGIVQALEDVARYAPRADCRRAHADFLLRGAWRALRLGQVGLARRACLSAVRMDPGVMVRLPAASLATSLYRQVRSIGFRATTLFRTATHDP